MRGHKHGGLDRAFLPWQLTIVHALTFCGAPGPLFILSGLIIACYASRVDLPAEWKSEMARYLKNHQRQQGPQDSGWGMCVPLRSLFSAEEARH